MKSSMIHKSTNIEAVMTERLDRSIKDMMRNRKRNSDVMKWNETLGEIKRNKGNINSKKRGIGYASL